jgi:hypothetical protein
MGAPLLTASIGTTDAVDTLLAQSGVSSSEIQSALRSQLENLSPDVLGQMGDATGVMNTLGPIADMATTIASGSKPSPQMVIGGLAVAATMTMGPIAGAAVAVAGEAVSAIFDALQGPPPPPPPEWNYKGFLRLGQIQGAAAGGYDPIPYGPNDPKWIHFSSARDVINAVLYGLPQTGSVHIDGNFSFGTAALLAVCLDIVESWPRAYRAIQYDRAQKRSSLVVFDPISAGMAGDEDAESFYAASYPSQGSYADGNDVIWGEHGYNSPAGNDARTSMIGFDALYGLQQCLWQGMVAQGGFDPAQGLDPAVLAPYTSAAPQGLDPAVLAPYTSAAPQGLPVDPHFSILFASTLARNIEQWANGHSFIEPYQLLLSCVAAWNGVHSNSSTVTFSPYDFFASDYQLTYSGMHIGIVESHYTIASGDVKSRLTNVFFWRNPIYTVLRGWQFDIVDPTQVSFQMHPPITINTGPKVVHLAVAKKTVAPSTGLWADVSGMSTPAKVALGVAAVPAVAVAGGAMYAFATQQATSAVLGRMWKGVKRPFARRR